MSFALWTHPSRLILAANALAELSLAADDHLMRFPDFPRGPEDEPDERVEPVSWKPDPLADAQTMVRSAGSDESHKDSPRRIKEQIRADTASGKYIPASSFDAPVPDKSQTGEGFAEQTAKAFGEWAGEKLAIAGLHAIAPPLAVAAVVTKKIIEFGASLNALAESDDPHVIVPIGQLFPGLEFEINVPLGGTTVQALDHTTCFIAPNDPTDIGCWTFQAARPDESPRGTEIAPADEDEPEAEPGPRPASVTPLKQTRSSAGIGFQCEVDLQSLGLDEDAQTRARQLYVIAREYAKVKKQDHQQHADFLTFVDKVTGEGYWWRQPREPRVYDRGFAEVDIEFRTRGPVLPSTGESDLPQPY